MQAQATAQSQPRSRISDSLAMIGLGTLLLLLTMFILTLFHTDVFGNQHAVASSRAISGSKAVAPGLTALSPVNLSGATTTNNAQLSDADQLRALIERVNRAFIEARSTANGNPLSSVATGDWLAQEQGYLAAMRGRGQTERWRLVNIQFVKIEPGGTTGFVCTRETWEYSIVNANGVSTPLKTVVLNEGYYLTRTSNGWLVNRLEVN